MLADAMPRLILEARRVAATVIHGLHGRRRAGPGENFWQYRRFMSRRAGAQRRLAALGARRSSLCARARMGSLAHGLALARPFAVDGLRLRAGYRVEQARTRAGRRLRAGRSAGAGRRAGRHSRLDAPDRQPQRDREDGAGDPARHRRNAPACRRRFRAVAALRNRDAVRPVEPDRRSSAARSASFPPPARTATWCRSSIRPRKASPIPAASNSSSRKALGSITAGRAETWRNDYQGLVAHHRAAHPRRDRPARLELHRSTAPTGRPSELLLVLHSRMGASAQTTSVSSRHTPALHGRAA